MVRGSAIGRGVHIHSNAYIDSRQHVHIPKATTIGYNLERDRELEGHHSTVDMASVIL